jgi:peptidyl-prolyl cis-trans isomerase A (cyclophilin A)
VKTLSLALSLAMSLALAGCCNSDNPNEPAAKPDNAKTSPAAGKPSAGDLDPAKATEKAPDVFKAKFSTTKGDFTVEVHRDWSPNGADRFYNLVKMGFFDDIRFFRVVDGFMAQVGLHGDPTVNAKWRKANIPDDPVKQSNKRGYLSFAMGGPGSRTTQFFINFIDNTRLDGMGFAPFAQVVDGMNIVDSLNKEYGEGAPAGKGPDQGRIQMQGNAYLDADFPRLDKIKTARIAQ